MKIDGISPLECQSFLDMINRGGLIKPSDIVYSSCVVAWDVYSRIMESYEAKSYFLSCKMQRNVFLKVVMIETHANENNTGILEATCINEHCFADIYEKILTNFFNVMCKNFVSEVNSATHKAKKRKNEYERSKWNIIQLYKNQKGTI